MSIADAGPAIVDLPDSRKPVLRSARVGKVYAALFAAIVDHRLTPGTRLPEDEIGTVFGASRTIVRAALQALAHERLVTIEPNRGAQVSQPTIDEARQVFEARSLIEARVAALLESRGQLARGLAGDAEDSAEFADRQRPARDQPQHGGVAAAVVGVTELLEAPGHRPDPAATGEREEVAEQVRGA